jgi:hypothetical protein
MVKIEGIDALIKHLEYKVYEVQARSREMVHYFTTRTIAFNAIDLTPYGELNDRTESYYRSSDRIKYMPPVPGSAKGGWQITVGSTSDDVFPSIAYNASGINIKNLAEASMRNTYSLGETIYVENLIPYMTQQDWPSAGFGSIEGGYSSQAPNGIMTPMQQLIASSYKISLKQGYNSAKIRKYKRG